MKNNKIGRRDFLIIGAGAPLGAELLTSKGGKMEPSPPTSLVAALASIAPRAVAARLSAGPGLEVRTGEPAASFPESAARSWFLGQPVNWVRSNATAAEGGWRFRLESDRGLAAESLLSLIPSRRAATIKTCLTNTTAQRSEPIAGLSALFLRLVKMAGAPRVMSSTGGAYSYQYPPHETFYTRWHVPEPGDFNCLDFGAREHRGSFGKAVPPGETPAGFLDVRSEDRGSSSKDLPLLLLAVDEKPDAAGFFFGMEWSATWQAKVAYAMDGEDVRVGMGPEANGIVIAAGESLDLPAVHLGFYEGGFARGSNALRRYIVEEITPHYQGKPITPPVCYTIWPGITAPYTEKDLYPQVDAAAELGVEMFIVDDSWYPGDFPKGSGNWRPDPLKFPGGMNRFAEYVAGKGMGFGLWFDPEVAGEGTTILQEHPDFFYPRAGANQGPLYLYDFTQSAARDYVVKYLSEFIERYHLRYLRWDSNIRAVNIWRAKDPTDKIVIRHFAGLYEVWERLTSRYPELVLECCAGGANRIDLGTLHRHHTGWMNDNTINPHIYHTMLLGAHTFLPGNYFGVSVGWPVTALHLPDSVLSRLCDRDLPDLSFISRLPGLLFLHGHLAEWSPETKRRARHWIEVYKCIRHLLVKDYYRLLPQPQSEADWDAAQFTDGDHGVIFAFRNVGSDREKNFRPQALESHFRYVLRDEANGVERTVNGNELIERGINIELVPHSARLLTYRRLAT